MYVIAIHDLKENKQDPANALAGILKVTPFEALSRLRAPGNGPCVVGIVAEKEETALLAKALQTVT